VNAVSFGAMSLSGFTKREPGETVSLRHGKTHYIFQGPVDDPTAPLVVLLHGASVFSFIWDRYSQLLVAKGYRVLMFDFYGHGYSEVPSIKYNHHVYIEQFEQLLEYLHLFPTQMDDSDQVNEDYLPPLVQVDSDEPLDEQLPEITEKIHVNKRNSHDMYLIGHSMGGLVASEFAAKYKNMITKVVLFNSAGLPVDISLNNVLPFFLHHVIRVVRATEILDKPTHALGEALKYLGHKFEVSYDDLCQHAFTLDEEPGLLEAPPALNLLEDGKSDQKEARSAFFAIPNISVPKMMRGPMTYQILSGLRFVKSLHFLLRTWLYQLTVAQRSNVLLSIVRDFPLLDADHSKSLMKLEGMPVLVIWGEEDGLLPASLLHKFKKHLPHAILMRVPGTDHAAFLQKPAYIFDLMLRFFDDDLQEPEQGQLETIRFPSGESVLLIKP